MSDNVQINTNTSSGATIATDECTINGTAVQVPRSKIGHGTDGSYSEVSTSSPLPVQLRNSSGTELGTSGAPVRTDPTGSTAQPVTDNGGSLTVDVPDGSDVTQGAVADAVATAGGEGTVSAKLRRVTSDLGDVRTAVQVMDDWDESDRAKVNPIAGQAGVAAGAGAVGATTQRVTLASDDPAVAALQTLDNIVAGNEAQVDVVTQPARARTTDTVSAALATDALMNGTTALTPAFANINTATSGDQTLVAAVTSKKIRVLSLALIARGDVDAYFRSGTGGTALFGGSTAALDLTTNGGFVLPFNPAGWFETGSGAALVLNLSGATGVAGGLTYVEV